MEITRIQELVKKQAANKSAYLENGNIALQEQAVKEPVIPLPTTSKDTALENSTVTPPASTTTAIPSPHELRQFIKNSFVENRDFMRVAGIPKPILTKEGSVKILRYMHLRPAIRLLNAVFDHPEGVISYTVENHPIVSAIGASSTAEKKYAKSGIDAINTVCNMAYKRALIAAVKLLL